MNKNILFVNLPSIPFDEIERLIGHTNSIPQLLSFPMGLLYISSYLKKQCKNIETKLLDYPLLLNQGVEEKTIDDFIEKSMENVGYEPDIIAFSLIFSTSHFFFIKAAKIAKKKWPKATVFVGGIHATNCASILIEEEAVDYVMAGEGELAYVEMMQMENMDSVDQIKGIYSKNKKPASESIILCDYIEDLDEIPFPDWDLIDMNTYINSDGRKKVLGSKSDKKIATIITNRGCPFKCTFCSAHTVHGRKMRYRSVESVLAEMKCLNEKYGITLFIPEDDAFIIKPERTLTLLQGIRNLNIEDIELQFPNALAVNTLNEELIDELIRTGIHVITLAIESGSEYTQKYIIKKNCNLKKAKQLVQYMRDKDVFVRCYFILGFPNETKELMQETVSFVKQLGADWCTFAVAAPLIGSEMYQELVDLEYIKNDIELWSKAFFQERTFDTKEITADELKEFAYRANLECNFIHNANIQNGSYERALQLFYDIVRTYPFHLVAWECIRYCAQKLGNQEEAIRAQEKLKELRISDSRAQEMDNKYKDLIDELHI